MKEYFWEKK